MPQSLVHSKTLSKSCCRSIESLSVFERKSLIQGNYFLREVALKLWITCGTFSVGVNTFFGALKGGAIHFFIIEEGGANINLSDKNLVSRSWINWLQEVEHPDHLLCKADDWNHLFRDAWSSGFKNRMIRITRFMNAMNSLTSLDHQLHKARSSSFTKKPDK